MSRTLENAERALSVLKESRLRVIDRNLVAYNLLNNEQKEQYHVYSHDKSLCAPRCWVCSGQVDSLTANAYRLINQINNLESGLDRGDDE
jgi:hypothetical protein